MRAKGRPIFSGWPMFVLSLAVALALLMGSMTPPAVTAGASRPIEIAVQGGHPRTQYVTQKVMIPWAKRLEQRSGGRLRVTYFDPGGVVPADKVKEAVMANTLQIGLIFPYVPGELPFVRVVSLPAMAPSATIAALTGWRLYETNAQWRAQFPKELRVLFHGAGAAIQLHTVRKAVTKLEDLAGLKIIPVIPDPWISAIQALGAVPINIFAYDAYPALERGMADGMFVPLAPVRAMKIAEVAKHTTVVDLGTNVFSIVINRGVFDSLPPDLQKILIEEGGEKMSEAFGRALDDGAVEDAKWMLEQGNIFHYLSPDERARWVERLIPIRERYLAELESKGMPGRKIYQESLAIIQELVKKGKFIPVYRF